MRFGLGPVFAYERLTASRRWQYYALRSFGLAALLVALGCVAYSEGAFFQGIPVKASARLNRSYFEAMIGIEMALVMLAAPAAAAGTICLDRSRGTLEHLMTTDLSDAEIVLGKLVARLLPVMGLVACCLPVLAISTLLGGVDAHALAMSFAVIVAVGLLACALALAFSVWARRPFEVILAVYMVWAIAVLAHPLWEGLARTRMTIEPPEWLLLANPLYVAFTSYSDWGTIGTRGYLGFFGASLILSALLVFLAIRGLRPAVIGTRRRVETVPGRDWLARVMHRLPGPSLDGNPVLWREWHRARSPRLSLLLVLLVAATIAASAVKAFNVSIVGLEDSLFAGPEYYEIYAYLLTTLFAGVVLAAVSPMSLSEERRRGSLDVLMATPLPTRAIVLGKWLSLYRTVPWLAIGPGLLGLALAISPPLLRRGHSVWLYGRPEFVVITPGDRLYACGLIVATILAHGAAIVSLGLGLATWLRRESRAIGLSVAAFILVSVAWPFVCRSVMGPYATQGRYFAVGAAVSPIYALTAIVSELSHPDNWWWPKLDEVRTCTGWVAVAAILILLATIATFDRQMGRMPARGRKPSIRA